MSFEKGSVVTVDVLWEDAVTDLLLTIRKPSGATVELSYAMVEHDSGAAHHYDQIADEVGDWYFLWQALAPGLGPKEGNFQVDENRTTVEGVTDQRDVRVMIPRVRRAIDGPSALSPLSPSTTLNDDEVTALIADAVASIILNTGSAFGHTLEVSARDSYYLAPTAWIVDPEFTEAEGSVVVAEAALTFYFHKFQELKIQEEISDEGQTWSWSISASLVRDQMQMLRDARDRALEIVNQQSNMNLDSYVSYIAIRDAATSLYIEPWVTEHGGIGGQEGVLTLGYDARFE